MDYHRLVLENYTNFTKKVYENLNGRGLTSGQPKVLEYLSDHDGAVQKDIALACHIEPATVTSLLSCMEKSGLITRQINPDNRRFWNVYLTEKGKAEAAYVVSTFHQVEQAALSGFSDAEIDTLLQYLDRIRQNLNQ